MKITVMCKSILFQRTIASVFFLFFLVMGCEETTQPPVKPTVVKKRITEKSSPSVPEKSTKPEASQQVKQDAPVEPKAVPSENRGQQTPSQTEAPAVKTQIALQDGSAAEESVKSGDATLTERLGDTTPRYSSEGKVDPFVPIFKDTPEISTEAKEKKALPKRPLTPLEKVDLSQLKLVAIVRSASGNRAMVEDATGKGYVISNGSYVGKNGGRVVQIERDRAFIEEEVEDILGKIVVTRKELKLQKPPGEE
jgi:type IV pilus assembly protein PilP